MPGRTLWLQRDDGDLHDIGHILVTGRGRHCAWCMPLYDYDINPLHVVAALGVAARSVHRALTSDTSCATIASSVPLCKYVSSSLLNSPVRSLLAHWCYSKMMWVVFLNHFVSSNCLDSVIVVLGESKVVTIYLYGVVANQAPSPTTSHTALPLCCNIVAWVHVMLDLIDPSVVILFKINWLSIYLRSYGIN